MIMCTHLIFLIQVCLEKEPTQRPRYLASKLTLIKQTTCTKTMVLPLTPKPSTPNLLPLQALPPQLVSFAQVLQGGNPPSTQVNSLLTTIASPRLITTCLPCLTPQPITGHRAPPGPPHPSPAFNPPKSHRSGEALEFAFNQNP